MRGAPAIRGLGLVGLGLFLAGGFTPLPNVLSRWLAAPARVEPAEAIVVLGAGLRADGSLTDASLRRALHGILLYREGLAPWLVVLGPERPGVGVEAGVRAELARALGVPPAAILTEATAWTTREEAVRARALLAGRGVRRILLVTNPHHMWRARAVFERAGFEVQAAPTQDFSAEPDTVEGRLDLLRDLAQELFGRSLYRLAGNP